MGMENLSEILREFIFVWHVSNNVDEVVERTGYTKQECVSLANRLRRIGVELKDMRSLNRSERILKRFIEAWQDSDSIREVARKTGSTKQECGSMAAQLRKQGVELKRFRTHPQKPIIDWDSVEELGIVPDRVIAERLGVPWYEVSAAKRKRQRRDRKTSKG
jgi:hypothetical protein